MRLSRTQLCCLKTAKKLIPVFSNNNSLSRGQTIQTLLDNMFERFVPAFSSLNLFFQRFGKKYINEIDLAKIYKYLYTKKNDEWFSVHINI